MTAINLSFARIKDAALFSDYVTRASDIMRDYDVEVVTRGDFAEAITPSNLHPSVGAVFRYPSLDVARAFFASEAYRALIPLRDRACTMTIFLFDETTDGSAAIHSKP